MQIFAGVNDAPAQGNSPGVPLGGSVKRHWGLSTTTIFGDLGGYVFANFRDTASNII